MQYRILGADLMISGFSSNFVKDVLDNPVYMGKIAYGRRRTEKKIGSRNEMHVYVEELIRIKQEWQLMGSSKDYVLEHSGTFISHR